MQGVPKPSNVFRHKHEYAEKLASLHFDTDEALTHVYRVLEPGEVDSWDDKRAQDNVKILEVTGAVVTTNEIQPIYFGAHFDLGGTLWPPLAIIQVTPEEFEKLVSGILVLPHGWKLGGEILKKESSHAAS